MFSHFWDFKTVDSETGCWNWTKAVSNHKNSYGRMRVGDKIVLVPRYSYEFFIGPIPNGLVVRHKCDNPPCFNPEHLMVGEPVDNVQDSIERGRRNQAKGSQCKHAKLTKKQVLKIRRMLADGSRDKEVANIYGMSRSAIGQIRRRETWNHI